jgi:hypothetical protein
LLFRDPKLREATNDLRDPIEFARRGVVLALENGRIVYWEAAGVECRGEEISRRSSSSSVIFSSLCGSIRLVNGSASESSSAGTEGSEGISWPSTASIRRHTRDGVSSIAAIATEFVDAARCCCRGDGLNTPVDRR